MSAQATTLANQQDAGAMVDAYVDALLGMPLVPAPVVQPQPAQDAHAAPDDAQANAAESGSLPAPDALPNPDSHETHAATDGLGHDAASLADAGTAAASALDAWPDDAVALAPTPPSPDDAHPAAAPLPDADATAAPEPEAWPDEALALAPARGSFDDAQPAAAPPMPQAMPPARAALAEPAFPPLAEPEEDRLIHTAPVGQRWLRVAVGDDRYAVELLRVQEVVRMAPVIAVRGALPSLLGVMNLRGRVVPVHDLGRWLRRHPVQPDERARIVVLEYQDELVGLLVTAVTDVVTLDTPQIEPPTPGLRDRIGMGIARTPGAPPTVLLDARVVFD